MYPLRWFVLFRLDEQHGSFVTAFRGIRPSEDKINWMLLCVYFFIIYCISFVIPKSISVRLKKKYKKMFKFFILFSIILKFLQILLGWRMDRYPTGILRIIGFLDGLMPPDLLILIVILFFDIKKSIIVIAINIMFSFFIASKAGLIHIALSIYSVYILRGGKIINKKFLILFFTIMILYPLIYYIMNRQRNDLIFSKEGLENFLKGENIILFAMLLLSRRITGIDILMIPKIENSMTFSLYSTISYLIKGVLPSNVIDFVIRNDRSIGQGRRFAEEYFGQNETIANAFEISLYGQLYFSNNIIGSIIVLSITIIGIFLLCYKFRNKWIISLTLIYFIKVFCTVIMTGGITGLTVIIRQIFVLIVFVSIYNSIYQNGINGIKELK
jgi:hypothetical protein